MEYKGIVIALTSKKALISTGDFECFYISRTPTLYVGKEIAFSKSVIINNKKLFTKLMSVAACIAILLVSAVFLNNMYLTKNKGTIINDPKVFAYVDVDINPSVEMEIDNVGNVIKLIPLNDDAKLIYKSINVEKFSVSTAITSILKEIKKNNNTNLNEKDYVLVSSTLNNKNDDFSKDFKAEQQCLDNLMTSVKANLQMNNKISVYLYKASTSERNTARKEGISTGRYILYKNSVNMNGKISIDDAKTLNVKEFIKSVENTNIVTDNTVTDNHTNSNGSTPKVISTDDVKPNTSTSTPNKNTPTKSKHSTKKPTQFFDTQAPSLLHSPISNTPTPLVLHTSTSIVSNSNFKKFESFNFRGYYIRHKSFEGYLSSYVTPDDDSIYRIVPGLSDPTCVSFESKNFPGCYLVHENFKIVLRKFTDSKSYKDCGTFKKVPGLADKNLVSFQSFNYPNRYIRHSNYKVEISEIDTELGRKDATYILIDVN